VAKLPTVVVSGAVSGCSTRRCHGETPLPPPQNALEPQRVAALPAYVGQVSPSFIFLFSSRRKGSQYFDFCWKQSRKALSALGHYLFVLGQIEPMQMPQLWGHLGICRLN